MSYVLYFSKKKKKIIPQRKNYDKEELIFSKKRLYYQKNILFLYKSDKNIKITLDSELERINDEKNMTKIKEYMDFSLIIRDIQIIYLY